MLTRFQNDDESRKFDENFRQIDSRQSDFRKIDSRQNGSRLGLARAAPPRQNGLGQCLA